MSHLKLINKKSISIILIVAFGIGNIGAYINAYEGNDCLRPTATALSLPLSPLSKKASSGGRTDSTPAAASSSGEMVHKTIILVPREIKPREGRVALLPNGARELFDYAKAIGKNIEIYVEAGAGLLSRASDEDYSREGAVIVKDRETLEALGRERLASGFSVIELKVKEPLDIDIEGKRINEFEYLLPGGILDTYLHMASDKEMAVKIVRSGVTPIALEAIVGDAAEAPLFNQAFSLGAIVVPEVVRQMKIRQGKTLVCLDPMSIVAGIEASLQALIYLDENNEKISGDKIQSNWDRIERILNSYPNPPAGETLNGKHILITGGGTGGLAAAWMALKMGTTITITDRQDKIGVLKEIFREYGDRVEVVQSPDDINSAEGKTIMKRLLAKSDAVIGAALVPTGTAPITISKEIITEVSDEEQHKRRRVFIDIAIDQGGNIVYVKPDGSVEKEPRKKITYHHDPVRVGYGNSVYYLVANMPGRPGVISRAASEMLQASRLPHIKRLISQGLETAITEDKGLARGISAFEGILTDLQVGKDLGLPAKELREAMAEREFAPPSKKKTVFLDVGNVILFFDWHRAARGFAKYCDKDEAFIYSLLTSHEFQDPIERGSVTNEAIFEDLKTKLDLNIDYDTFVSIWNSLFEVNWSTVEIMKKLKRAGYKIYIISNTNSLHKDHHLCTYPYIFKILADGVISSFEVRARKPEREIFEPALAASGTRPDEAIFVDDIKAYADAVFSYGIVGIHLGPQTDLFTELKAVLEPQPSGEISVEGLARGRKASLAISCAA